MSLLKISMRGFLLLTMTTLTAHGTVTQPLTSSPHVLEKPENEAVKEIPINSEVKPRVGCNPLDPRCK